MRLISRLRAFFQKIRFGDPPRSDLVLFYDQHCDSFQKWVAQEIPFEGFDPDKTFYVSLKILWAFAVRLALTFPRQITRNIYSNVRWIQNAYFLTELEQFRPKVVVTFNDNSPIFGWIATRMRTAQFYAIQNGTRAFFELEGGQAELAGAKTPFRLHLTNFFCFGEFERFSYTSTGHVVENFIPVGSYYGGYYFKNLRGQPSVKYDIAVVSTWDLEEMAINGDQGWNLVVEYLSRYMRENPSLKVLIAPRRGSPEEEIYYRERLPPNYVFQKKDVPNLSSYFGVDEGDVVLSINSTLLIEAFGWGKKALFCDYYRWTQFKGWPESFWIERTKTYENFRSALDHIRQLSTPKYNELTVDWAQRIMAYDFAHPAHERIRDTLLKEL